MTPSIKNALSEEEWRAPIEALEALDSAGFARVEEDGTVTLDGRYPPLAVAAVMLDIAGPEGEPWFTWEDVDALRRVENNDNGEGGTDVAMLLGIADRIAALLPPREPNT